jgi:hypothetical protein
VKLCPLVCGGWVRGVLALAARVGCCELIKVEIEFPLIVRMILQSEHCDAWML